MSEQLLNPNLIHVAGWTLVHFPWQACLIGLLVGAGRAATALVVAAVGYLARH